MHVPAPPELLARIRILDGMPALLAALPADPPVHLVGGAVRDLLLARAPRELDLLVEGDALALAAGLDPGSVAHPRFGTATIQLDGHTIDLAGARRERYPHPGALPEVEPAALADDLERRDFTVNALAVRLTGDEAGAIAHVPHALDDLDAGQLRVLHAASFRDDPTRLLRLARYAARLCFQAEPGTAALAEEARDGGALATVSGTRLAAELRLLTREPEPERAFGVLGETGLDAAIAPGFGVRDPARARRARVLLGDAGSPERLMLGLALEGLGTAARNALIERLGLTGEESAVAEGVARAERLAAALGRAERPSQIAAAVGGAPPEAVAAAGALGPEPAARRWLGELRHVRLEIGGSDLLAAGVPAGPAIGHGLQAARTARLDGLADGREAELAVALRAAAERQ